MIDIHPAHHAATTRRDFFIHLTTIIIGLLIAIGLEQSVEALHRLHERHVLEAALHAECGDNKGRAEVNFSGYSDEMEWLLGLHGDIQKMLATGGRANLPYRELHYRPRPLEGVTYIGNSVHLATAVWDTAGADNRLALLPDQMARTYSFLYRIQGERFSQLRVEASDARHRQYAFAAKFADAGTPETPVLARMSESELKEYDTLVMQSFDAVHYEKSMLLVVYATNTGVLRGLYDYASMRRVQIETTAAFPDDFAKMAQQIAAEDAARDKAANPPAMKAVK
jgi:hypothetical protein